LPSGGFRLVTTRSGESVGAIAIWTNLD
jgi:hypothetical protein